MVWFGCVYIWLFCVTRRWVMWYAVMVGVYVHARAFVDCCMFMVGVLAVCSCMCNDASNVWLGIVAALGARVIASCGYHTSTMGACSM